MFGLVWLMVFNATFNNISVIWWQSVLLMEETRVSGETTDLSQVPDKPFNIMLYQVIGTDCTGSCKSNKVN
jgi:hypothetical protein